MWAAASPNKQGSRPLLKAGGAPSELGTRTSHLTLSWTHTPSFPQPEDFDLLDWQVEGTELGSRTGVWHPGCLCFTWPMQKAAMQGSFLADSQLTTLPSYCPRSYLNLRTNISSIFKSKTLVLITQCTGVLENSAFRNQLVNKMNGELPNVKTHRPRMVSLPAIIPLRIRWRASASFIKTDANKE